MTYICILTGWPLDTCDGCKLRDVCAGIDVATQAQSIDTSGACIPVMCSLVHRDRLPQAAESAGFVFGGRHARNARGTLLGKGREAGTR